MAIGDLPYYRSLSRNRKAFSCLRAVRFGAENAEAKEIIFIKKESKLLIIPISTDAD